MFDDTIKKSIANPNTGIQGINKLSWTSTAKSNVTNIDGLDSFNDTIKKSLKYLYLNNNSFTNVNSLKDFTNIVELQLMCNSNLSNIDGLENHSNLSCLTLHNCALTTIGNNDLGGLSGCSSLNNLTLQNNTNLTSLAGIESSINLFRLVANNCNLTNIDSLANHSKVSYLQLANNINLVNVLVIKDCKSINYIYLDNNVNMKGEDIRDSLNSSVSDTDNTLLISKCLNGYTNIPKKYWDYFLTTADALDFSYATIGEYLTDDSIKWTNLLNRTNLRKLNISGQTQLSKATLDKTLKTLTGMKCLSVSGITNIDNIDFVSNMNGLIELDIRETASSLTDLSKLNSITTMKTLIVSNYGIDFSKIQTTLNRFTNYSGYYDGNFNLSFGMTYSYWASGIMLIGDGSKYDFSNCKELTRFIISEGPFNNNLNSGTIDLSKCSKLTTVNTRYNGYSLKLPSQIKNFAFDNCNPASFDFSEVPSTSIIENISIVNDDQPTRASRIKNLNATVNVVSFDNSKNNSFQHIYPYIPNAKSVYFRYNFLNGIVDFIDIEKMNKLETIYVSLNSGINNIKNIENIANCTNLKSITIYNATNLVDLTMLKNIEGLTELRCSNSKLSDITGLSNLKNLKIISLDGGNITNLTPLVSSIGDDNKINYTELDIKNNSLDGYTVADNISALLKLHAAGLQKVYITGNNFSENEIQELINGKTIDGVNYSGFGSGNVVN